MRAPPESLMPMIGTRFRSASSCTLTIFSAVTSPSEPPKTVGSYAYTATCRPSISPNHGTPPPTRHASAARDPLVLHPESMRPVSGEKVHLHERPVVEQQLDPVAGG